MMYTTLAQKFLSKKIVWYLDLLYVHAHFAYNTGRRKVLKKN